MGFCQKKEPLIPLLYSPLRSFFQPKNIGTAAKILFLAKKKDCIYFSHTDRFCLKTLFIVVLTGKEEKFWPSRYESEKKRGRGQKTPCENGKWCWPGHFYS